MPGIWSGRRRLERRRGCLRGGRDRTDRARHGRRRVDRIPSSFSGVSGTSRALGLVPVYPASAVVTSPIGPMTWTVRDAALLLDVVAGHDPRDRFSWDSADNYLDALSNVDLSGLKAWSRDLGYAAVEPEVADLAERAAKVFAELGCEVVEDHPKLPDRGRSSTCSGSRRWPARDVTTSSRYATSWTLAWPSSSRWDSHCRQRMSPARIDQGTYMLQPGVTGCASTISS